MVEAPVRVAIMNDYEVVVAGVHRMLAPYEGRIHVVELVSQLPVHSKVDVLLYDAFSRERVIGPVQQVIAETDAHVIIYTWHLEPELVSEALSADDLVEAIEQVRDGATLVSADPGPDAVITPEEWPGKKYGLSPRESEVLALIAQGLSNQEVAERAYVTINSVKTFIRSAYRKIGVTRRTQAVLWATDHGIVPRSSRTILDES
jgi:DNA-binding NarL/FixJ family response regulator